METTADTRSKALLSLTIGLFLVSGFPALLYQIVWQRALFSVFGVNIESVTIVVAAFMLGLGLGSLAGGQLSVRSRRSPLLVFGALELGIAAYGAVSLTVFDWVGHSIATVDPVWAWVIAFVLILVPTTLMGATLPILVAHLVTRSPNVGRAVGLLYFANTFGSALACFWAAFYAMGTFGMQGTVWGAVALNTMVGLTGFVAGLRAPHRPGEASHVVGSQTSASAEGSNSGSVGSSALEEGARGSSISRAEGRTRLAVALFLSAVAGYLSLSYEIVWVRVFAFTSAGAAGTFATLLGAFLLGIALGSVAVRRLCVEATSGGDRSLLWLGVFVLLANLVGYAVVPVVARAAAHVTFWASMPAVAVGALFLGATFPLICHYGIRPDARAGEHMSYVYLANVAGSTLGSVLTGLLLMDLWSLPEITRFLALFGGAMGLGVVGLAKNARFVLVPVLVASALSTGAVLMYHDTLHDELYERLQYKYAYDDETKPFKHVLENRAGVITVDDTETIFGGGIYDGRFNTGLVPDRNAVFRMYAVGAFHPAPRKVLMIGLASGSWAKIAAAHPAVESLTVVEINPGYLTILERYAGGRALMADPKVEIVIDDGRRWLRRHPDERFDAIVMNTSYHWRSHMSGLLSVEFLELAKAHLAEGGILFYNTTGSTRVQKTGLASFEHGVRIFNFLMVSDAPLRPDKERWRRLLEGYTIDGRKVLDLEKPKHRDALEGLLRHVDLLEAGRAPKKGMESKATLWPKVKDEGVITEDNMGTEWRYDFIMDRLYHEKE